MVCVPGSSSDSGFHRESRDKDVKVKTEPGIEAPAEDGSPRTREEKRSQDHRGSGRGFDDNKVNGEDQQDDLEKNTINPS